MRILYCYTATEKCGCVTGIVIDNPDRIKTVAQDVTEFIESGRHVDRITLIDLHQLEFGCKCKDKEA